MKKLELANYGLVEMNEEEMLHTDGGVIGIDDLILAGAVFLVGVAYDLGKGDGAKNRNK
ncbi:hypothetical protein HDF24_19420 [Mucilaginibacter sp. X4EP1]|jgi:hypothetical protein|uniref:hypothetical protein n=1 Tax=Mucilaginibacter sp. X4EP1 TaxID=2723092 RepID=UPI002168E578|nr:hypothetical protein [Mucilaginibacter sp. X4EP1]MCS3812866.1 hypothetical protein [Mucilaginibacter sp. X4EP1]